MKIDDIKAKELAKAGDIEALREGGAIEVKAFNVGSVKVVARIDFGLLRKAYNTLISIDLNGGKSNAELDMIGAGDKVLMQGVVLGREEVLTSTKRRFLACQELGAWVAELASPEDEDEDETKKK